MNKKILASLLSGIALCSMSSAFAVDVTGNFQTTSTLSSTCTISAQDISFGTLNVISSGSIFANGGFNVLCSKGVNYTITPSGGYTDAFSSGSTQLLRGTTGNNDALLIQFTKNDNGAWGRTNLGPITGTGTGLNVAIPIKASATPTSQPKLYDASATNQYNYQTKPDDYSLTVTANVVY